MLSSPSEEDLVVKWLFAEAINYRNKGKPTHNPGALKWASKTRIHKIIFSVLEEFDIPVTRSWYMWGGFVHSEELDAHFANLRNDYSRNPTRTLGLRQKVHDIGVPTAAIKNSLEKRVDEVTSMPSKDFLLIYYKNESPLPYRPLYVAKQEISNFLDDIGGRGSPGILLDRGRKLGDCITRFHESSLMQFDDTPLKETTFAFTDLLENALDKLTLLTERRQKISNEKLSFFCDAKSVFDDFVWSPYACEISQNTVKGIRALSEKAKMKYQKERKISQAPAKLADLQNKLVEKKLEFSYEEIQALKETTFKEEKGAKALSELIGIYSRGNNGE